MRFKTSSTKKHLKKITYRILRRKKSSIYYTKKLREQLTHIQGLAEGMLEIIKLASIEEHRHDRPGSSRDQTHHVQLQSSDTDYSSDESEDAVPETQPTDETRTYQNQPQNHHMNTSS